MAHAITHRGTHARDNEDHEENDNTRQHAVVDRERARAEFGGLHLGAAFFGWLVATGLATILTALLAAAGSAVAVSAVNNVNSLSSQQTATVGLISGILLLIALAVSYYAGGYVAGRMSRFDGARQGLGAWLIGIVLTLILGGLGAALGSKYNVMQQLNLPHLPINQGSFTKGGLIASIAAIVITLIAAILGGKQGGHYHSKIDDAGEVDTVDM